MNERKIVRGLDRGSASFPALAERRLVADLLDAGQGKAWDAFDRQTAAVDAARAEVRRLRAELDRALVDDADAALAAARNGKPVPPSVRAERALAAEGAQRLVGALETLTAEAFGELAWALVPAQRRLIERTWAELADEPPKTPEALRRGMARTVWALHLRDGAGEPHAFVLEAFDALPLSKWAEAADGLLDQLGAEVADALAEDEA